MRRAAPREQGLALIVGLIMLVLITLIVISAFRLSSSNLKLVGNVQVRNEAVAAANQAIEQLVSTAFTNALGTQTLTIDIDKDGTTDYSVQLSTPTCLRSVQVDTCVASGCETSPTGCGASYAAGSGSVASSGTCGTYLTDWSITAQVTHASTGASVTVREGIRVPLDSSAVTAACP